MMGFAVIFVVGVALILLFAVLLALACCKVAGNLAEIEERKWEEHYNGDQEHDQQVDAAWWWD